MTDPYLEKLADILVDYSLGEIDFAEAWKNGQKRLMVTYEPPADELARLVTERVLDKGGNVFLDVVPSWHPYTFLYQSLRNRVEIKTGRGFEETRPCCSPTEH